MKSTYSGSSSSSSSSLITSHSFHSLSLSSVGVGDKIRVCLTKNSSLNMVRQASMKSKSLLARGVMALLQLQLILILEKG
ncbi:hypothetical protein LOK49_Contig48G00001 [Camellia lanceoleosa]|nr:hypothetical protein LOK49_Contig48G00001 [Camellia lanceoleosa]